MACLSDDEMIKLFECRSIKETQSIVNTWASGDDDVKEPESPIFMSLHALNNNLHNMELEIEQHQLHENTDYPFEKETYLYAAKCGHDECLKFALQNGSVDCYKLLYGIIPQCILRGHVECLKVAFDYGAPFCWWLDFKEDDEDWYYLDPFDFVHSWTVSYVVGNYVKELWNRVKCFRILLSKVQVMQEQEQSMQFESFELSMYLGKYNKLKQEHWPVFAKRILWKIFRIYVKHRMLINYWINMTGERTCAPDGICRKRHLEEFECDFLSEKIV